MKLTLRILTFLLAASSAWGVPFADVQFFFQNFTTQPSTLQGFIIRPTYPWTVNGQWIVTGDYNQYLVDTNASIIVSNMLPGTYRIEFRGPTLVTTNWLSVPTTNGLINAKDWIGAAPTNVIPGLGIDQANVIFWRKDVLQPGTNTTFRTNTSGVFIDTQAGGGSGAFSNNVTIDASHALSLSNATINRVLMVNGSSQVTNVAPGTVPIDGDGTATTATQLNALLNPWTVDYNGGGHKLTNVLTASFGNITNRNSGGLVVQVTDVNGSVIDAAVTGSVPLDANGTATTAAQINALFPGIILTNGESQASTFSNNVAVDATHAIYPTNVGTSKLVGTDGGGALTNVVVGAGLSLSSGTLSATGGGGDVFKAGNNTFTGINTFSNNVYLDATHALFPSNSTPSRVAMIGADNSLTNASASGAVPINADGTATTASQVPALLNGISDYRLENRMLDDALGFPYRTPNKQRITLAAGQSFIHGFIYALGKFWATTLGTPAQLLRFNNPEDLTDYTVLTFANDGAHNSAYDLIYVPQTGKIYIPFAGGVKIYVSEIDPSTLAVVDRIADATERDAESIASDGSSLFIAGNTAGNVAWAGRYRMSDWTLQDQFTFNTFLHGHTIRYDGSNVFMTCSQGSPYSSIAKITPGNFSSNTTNLLTIGIATDDLAMNGDYVYCADEVAAAVSTPICRIKKSDLTTATIATGIPGGCYGIFFDGRYIWGVFRTSPGVIGRIDPNTAETYSWTLDNTENTPNEVFSDGQRLFITTYTDPSMIMRITPPPMGIASSAFAQLANSNTFTGPLTTTNTVDLQAYVPPPALGNWTNGLTSYVTTTGNDGTAVRGDSTHPYLTIESAVSHASAGDTINIAAGAYNISNYVHLTEGMAIQGAGTNGTYITNWCHIDFAGFPSGNGQGAMFQPNDNSTISNLTVIGNEWPTWTHYQAAVGTSSVFNTNGSPGFTNASAGGLRSYNGTDGIYINDTNRCQLFVFNPSLYASYDVIACAGATNHDLRIFGGSLTTSNVSGAQNGGIRTSNDGRQTVFVHGSSLFSDIANNTFLALFGSNTVTLSSCTYNFPNSPSTWATFGNTSPTLVLFDSSITNSLIGGVGTIRDFSRSSSMIHGDGTAYTNLPVGLPGQFMQSLGTSAGYTFAPALTNGQSIATVFSNSVAIDVRHALSPSNSTPSRIAMIGADNTLTNAGATSAATPINRDGSATTFANLNTLAPGNILTNGMTLSTTFSNALAVDKTHAFSPSNATASVVAFIASDGTLTNDSVTTAVPINGNGTATTAAQINALFPGVVVTNGESQSIVHSNSLAIDAAHALSLSNATTARVLKLNTDNTVTNVAASGAVPLDADGSATTFAQVNALAPGNVVTQGFSLSMTFSNALAVDKTHAFSPSNAVATTLAVIGADNTLTNGNLAGDVTTANGSLNATVNTPKAIWAGNTGNALVNAATVAYFAPNGTASATNINTSDTSVFTRNIVTRTVTIQNLYVLLSAAPGASIQSACRVYTNGTFAQIIANITGASTTSGNDTTHTATIVAGTEVGIQYSNATSAANTKVSWALELK